MQSTFTDYQASSVDKRKEIERRKRAKQIDRLAVWPEVVSSFDGLFARAGDVLGPKLVLDGLETCRAFEGERVLE